MYFNKIGALAFGPLQGATLELAPGMNVIYGPNEAGKSSWHAALYAGLCGIRRAQGNSKDVRDFTERHKPWDGGHWEVNAVITLADGRSVELGHNLVNRYSSVRDTNLAGRDYANEIMFEGAPDGSRWLGLNRRTFLSTACVRQADILGILESPAMLQNDMQRAAATAGADSTAAAALQRLDNYRREVVGTSRAPTKPLRQSADEERRTRSALEYARAKRAQYLERREQIDQLEREAQDFQNEAAAMQAVIVETDAQKAQERFWRIKELDSRFPEGTPHPSPERDQRASQVEAALRVWGSLSELVEPSGPSVEEITRLIENSERQLAAKHAAVAEREADEAKRRSLRTTELSSLFPDGPPRTSTAEEQLAEQARAALRSFEALSPPPELAGESAEAIEAELAEFDARVRATRSTGAGRRLLLLILSGIAVTVGVAVALTWPDLLIVGAGIIAIGAIGIVSHHAARPRAQDQLVLDTSRRTIEQRLNARIEQEHRYQDDLRQRDAVLARLFEVAEECGQSVPDQQSAIRILNDWLQARSARLREYERLSSLWDELQGLLGGRLPSDIETAARHVEEEATRLIASADENLLAAARAENVAREQLSRLEERAGKQRIERELQRAERSSADKRFQEDSDKVDAARDGLRAAGEAIDAHADDYDDLATALSDWLQRRTQSIAEAQELTELWDERQQLLGKQSLEDAENEVERLQQEVQLHRLQVGVDALTKASAQQPTLDDLNALKEKQSQAKSNQDEAHGELAEFARTMPSVPDAEEALANTERIREHLANLDSTLERTIGFLESAQERVHRDVAPILRRTVLEWLPHVTGGRYIDCRVNPESLAVDLAGGDKRWHNAALLSRGTAEQVYLLLRLALAQHLTREEPCPLILDDAVAACDARRKQAVLDTLLAISESESVQVILFTHEEDVRGWARNRLAHPDHLLKELDQAPTVT